MDTVDNITKDISPKKVLKEISNAIPKDCKKHMIIVGSLAVGYYFFKDEESMAVRTKDADCLLSPRIEAVHTGEAITNQLIDNGWNPKKDTKWSKPGDDNTADEDLPAVRLYPPESSEWFIELLTVPASPKEREKKWVRLKTKHGYFALCSLGFLSLTNYEPILTDFGIYVARPEMMALANMLHHPEIGSETMSGPIEDRTIKRSNKDLGRVLAIARLAIGKDSDAMLEWPELWKKALQDRFPEDWQALARRAGSGIKELLSSAPDLDEAVHTCQYGLLSSRSLTSEQLRITGERLLQDAIVPLENIANLT